MRTGAHARRRAGAGDGFWSYRPYRPGDEPRRIDWRRSARGDEVLIREVEQVQAATVLVWPDRRAGMRWRSGAGLPLKSERATVLALALAVLLGRGGERCGLLGAAARPATGVQAAERLAQALATTAEDAAPGEGAPRALRVWITDALEPAAVWAGRLGASRLLPIADGEVAQRAGGAAPRGAEASSTPVPLASRAAPPPLRGISPSAMGRRGEASSDLLLFIADPAEVAFPYAGRVLFSAPGGHAERRLGRAESAAAEYAAVRAVHFAEVAAVAQRAGVRVLEHRTDQPAATALLALWLAVAGAA